MLSNKKRKTQRIWVDDEFYQEMKILAFNDRKSIIQKSRDLVPILRKDKDKGKERKNKEIKNVFGFKI